MIVIKSLNIFYYFQENMIRTENIIMSLNNSVILVDVFLDSLVC